MKKRFKNFISMIWRRRSWRYQCIQTQKALRGLYHAVQKSKSANDPIGMAQAMDEAGKWF